MSAALIALGLLVALGLFLLGVGGARLRRRRVFAATRSGAGGGLCLALAGLGVAFGLNLYTYQRLSYEQPVAEIAFTATGAQQYRAVLTPARGPVRRVQLRGDEWQLDARVLKWKALANLLGFDAVYRLERLSGRYADVAEQNSETQSANALNIGDPGLDAWTWAHRLPRWVAPFDAQYGSATYLPMANGARYSIRLSQTGLVARALNDPARAALRHW